MKGEVRLLPKNQAARYCGIPVSRFATVCPKRPIRLAGAEKLKWDIKDLDEWIDSIKKDEETADDIVGKL